MTKPFLEKFTFSQISQNYVFVVTAFFQITAVYTDLSMPRVKSLHSPKVCSSNSLFPQGSDDFALTGYDMKDIMIFKHTDVCWDKGPWKTQFLPEAVELNLVLWFNFWLFP